ncbi:unnamed protein product [Alopecurus aequalis]
MEGEVSKKELESVLTQAMFAAKNIQAQHGRLVQYELQLGREKTNYHLQSATGTRLEELVTGLVKTLHLGLEAGARYLASCKEIDAANGARLTLSPGFAAMPDEQLYHALLDLQLPARPTTLAEAFTSIEVAFYSVKLAREHYLGSCIGLLLTVAPPDTGPAQDSGKIGRPDNPFYAVSKKLFMIAFSLGRVSSLAELAVKHLGHAVLVISRFIDPNEVARLVEFAEKHGII